MARALLALPALMAMALTSGCETANQAGNAVKSVGETVADTAGGLAEGAVSLVNVNLSNVLNDLALDLNIDKANIPINAQIPITLAANVCGVSINILSVSTGGSPNCSAQSTSPELSQAVQQQMAANGSVGGGSQTGASGASGPTGTSTSATTPTSSGAANQPANTALSTSISASGQATTESTTPGTPTSGTGGTTTTTTK